MEGVTRPRWLLPPGRAREPEGETLGELLRRVAGAQAGRGLEGVLGGVLEGGLEPGQRPLAALARAPAGELQARFGLPKPAAERLAAAFELGRRVERARAVDRPALRSAERVHRFVLPLVRGLRREVFLALLVDGKHRWQRTETVSQGTLTSSLVHPREVFGAAIRESAAAVIAVHNHPSGDPEPSREDLEVTRRLLAAGRLLGVPLLDHLVVGGTTYVSLRDRMDFGADAP